MNYIVFDLEWNQSPDGKRHSDQKLPFEIIEIGAVKLDRHKTVTDTFHRLIKPQVYKWIHDSIHEVTHVCYKDLENGMPFVQAAREFLDWCGEDGAFFTWGTQDVTELQRNMRYYGVLSMLPGPVTYYDVQKLFSLRFDDGKQRISLAHATERLGIEKNTEFHRALSDAFYTARILMKIEEPYIFPNSSLDVYQNPKKKKDEIHISYPTYDKYVSREFPDREKMMKDREVTSTRCPMCGAAAKRTVRWFMHNTKNYYSLSVCPVHGVVKGKIRTRRSEEDMVFAVKTVKLISAKEAEEIRRKRESHRRRKQLKNVSEKEV